MNNMDSWGFAVDGNHRFRVMFSRHTVPAESARAFTHPDNVGRAAEFAKMVLTTSGIWDGAQQ
jgi:hypothetical protein